MIVKFENLISKQTFTKNFSHQEMKKLENRVLWSIDDVIYWVIKVMPFDSHYNVLINPLYAWEVMVKNGDWSIFDTIANDKTYSLKITDKLCLRHDSAEPGISDKTGNAIYLKTYDFDKMPKIKSGDIFVFGNVSYLAKSFEIHRRVCGEKLIDRVIVVTHDASDLLTTKHKSIVSNEYIFNPLNYFLGGFCNNE